MTNEITISDITIAGIGRALDTSLATSVPLMLLSAPGVGKTASITTWAASNHSPVLPIYAAQIEPVMLSGMHIPATMVAGTSPDEYRRAAPDMVVTRPAYVKEAWNMYEEAMVGWKANPDIDETRAFITLFFDEVTAGAPDVQSALLEYVQERSGAGFPLPPNTHVVLAGNRPEDGASIRSVNAALVNRCAVMNVRAPTASEWIAIMSSIGKSPNPIAVAYLGVNPTAITTKPNPAEFAKVAASPRQWDAASRVLDAICGDNASIGDMSITSPEIAMLSGVITRGIAQELAAMATMFAGCTPFKAAIKNPMGAGTPEGGDMHVEMIQTAVLSRGVAAMYQRSTAEVPNEVLSRVVGAALQYLGRISASAVTLFKANLEDFSKIHDDPLREPVGATFFAAAAGGLSVAQYATQADANTVIGVAHDSLATDARAIGIGGDAENDDV